jgi:hypothetical protein
VVFTLRATRDVPSGETFVWSAYGPDQFDSRGWALVPPLAAGESWQLVVNVPKQAGGLFFEAYGSGRENWVVLGCHPQSSTDSSQPTSADSNADIPFDPTPFPAVPSLPSLF